MKATDLLVVEHDNIRKMLRIITHLSYNFMEGLDHDVNDYYLVLDFMKHYVDDHHHKKEDGILFKVLEEKSDDSPASKAILAMKIEHNSARLYRANLEEALKKYNLGDNMAKLDIIANSVSYVDLMERHIFKENSAIYLLAEDLLSKEESVKIIDRFNEVEKEAEDSKLQVRFKSMMDNLEEKYLEE